MCEQLNLQYQTEAKNKGYSMQDMAENLKIYTKMVLNMSPFVLERYYVAFNQGGYVRKADTRDLKLWCEPEATDELQKWLKEDLRENGAIAPRQARGNPKDPFWTDVMTDIRGICNKLKVKTIRDIKGEYDVFQMLEEFPLAFVSDLNYSHFKY